MVARLVSEHWQLLRDLRTVSTAKKGDEHQNTNFQITLLTFKFSWKSMLTQQYYYTSGFCSDQIIDKHTKKSPKFSTTWHFDTLISSIDYHKLEDLNAGNSKIARTTSTAAICSRVLIRSVDVHRSNKTHDKRMAKYSAGK